MSHLMHRSLRSTPPLAIQAAGCWITDHSGRRYLDASGGAAVSSLGHAHPAVLAAMHAQIDQLAYAHTGFFTSIAAEALGEVLASGAPGDLDQVYLVSGGSEAMEAALKFARQVCLEKGESTRRRFIARRQSYHGNTLGALGVGGNAWRRAPFAPLLADAIHVSPCYPYRGRAPGQSLQDYTDGLLAELEAAIIDAGPETLIGFVAETVGGATAGALTPTPGYFAGVRALCDKYGLLLILDEVMCGMGRCGSLYAFEQEQVLPDIVAVAKGLGAGYQPIGAMLARGALVDVLRAGSGSFQHGHTYLGHPVAAAAALAVQQTIARDKLLDKVRLRGAQLRHLLEARFGQHPHVGEIRGRGLLLALELVEDRASARPFAPERQIHAQVKAQAMAAGLMVYPMGGTVDGRSGDHVLLAPPFIISEAELEELVARLEVALTV
ncbi:aspartate aminotransferase family protein [Massilia sp. TS11]|uniref:aspartate aminotransferase family protein n=1 Tax=Massilia sp. TS11 TaxID=2908003 RepID=UPI001EDA68B1|nr:aspartate aminotransferase family protein [Massilia sp. TS11]MCG2586263.1 aspartate aminotransferase family protein [Massilia sp. TS11]